VSSLSCRTDIAEDQGGALKTKVVVASGIRLQALAPALVGFFRGAMAEIRLMFHRFCSNPHESTDL
jgi:hypothetical protein